MSDPKHCSSYTPGHDVHVIQWKLWAAEPHERIPCRAEVDDDGSIRLVVVDGRTLARWTHDPDRLAGLLARAELGSHGVLSVATKTGAALVCLGDEPTACPHPGDQPADLIDALMSRGGFLVRGSDQS